MMVTGIVVFIASEGYTVTSTNMRLAGEEKIVTTYPPSVWNEGFMVGLFIVLISWLSYNLVLGLMA